MKIKSKIDLKILLIMILYLLICFISSIVMFGTLQVRNGLMAILFMVFPVLLIIASKVLKFELTTLFTTLILLLALGGLTGTIYELYMIIPIFDDLLHGLSGFLFALLGFALMKHFVGNEKNMKNLIGCLAFGFCFSLAIAVIWELFEYTTGFFGLDMQEDTIITEFNSYLLAGSHSEIVSLGSITKTIIYYGNGKSIVIDGYLDTGLIDTITDMFICFLGTIGFTLVATITYFKFPKFNDSLIPNINTIGKNFL